MSGRRVSDMGSLFQGGALAEKDVNPERSGTPEPALQIRETHSGAAQQLLNERKTAGRPKKRAAVTARLFLLVRAPGIACRIHQECRQPVRQIRATAHEI